MKNKLSSLIFALIILLGLSASAFAEIIFEDDFDNQNDWQSNQPKNSVGQSNIGFPSAWIDYPCTTNCPPENWTSYRVAVSGWLDDDRRKDAFYLDEIGRRGSLGKGLTRWHEYTGNWNGGGINKYIVNGSNNISVRFYMKFSSDWIWPTSSQQKLIRIGSYSTAIPLRYKANENIDVYGSAGWNSPVYYPDWYSNYGYGFYYPSYRYAPGYVSDPKNYNIFSARMPNDSMWHSYEFTVKLNSLPGISDGFDAFYIDGILQYNKTDVMWVNSTPWKSNYDYNNTLPFTITPINKMIGYRVIIDNGTSGLTEPNWSNCNELGENCTDGNLTWEAYTDYKWNHFIFNDNIYTPYNVSLFVERSFYSDDFVISTDYVGTDWCDKAISDNLTSYCDYAYSNVTTNLSVSDLSGVENLTLEYLGLGKVKWFNTLNITGYDFDRNMEFSKNFISVNSNVLKNLNSSAEITFYNVTFSSPAIFKDGIRFYNYTNLNYNRTSNEFSFIVNAFSNYSILNQPIIFEDDFDNQPDWASPVRTVGGTATGWSYPNTWIEYNGTPKYPPPNNWTSWQSDGSEFINISAGNFTSTHIISELGARGYSGKGYTTNMEFTQGTVTGGSIGKYLGEQGYNELYFQYYAKFDSSWFWYTTNESEHQGQAILKMMHVGVTPVAPLTVNKGPDLYGAGGTVPNWVVTIATDAWRNKQILNSVPRVSNGTNYLASPYSEEQMSNISWPNDARWHLYSYRLKMNTISGVSDGEVEFWLDGNNDNNHHFIRTNITFKLEGNNLTRGFNWVTLISNFRWNTCSGTCPPPPLNYVSPIYVDNFKVSTNYIGTDWCDKAISDNLTSYCDYAYSNVTTNLSVSDLSGVENLTLEYLGLGKVKWFNTLNITGYDFDRNMEFSKNFISVNSNVLKNLNSTAEITFYNVTFSSPAIFKDGIRFYNYTNLNYNRTSNEFSFIVNSFSNYSIENQPIIFEDNFDNQSEWQSNTCVISGVTTQCYNNSCNYPGMVDIPNNWFGYYSDEFWNPNCLISNKSVFGSNPVMQISNFNNYGNLGKSFTFYSESTQGSGSDGFGANGELIKTFDEDYDELYGKISIKFQPNYRWYYVGNSGMLKIFRMYHWDRVNSPMSYFKEGYSNPIYFFTAVQNEWGFYFGNAARCEPRINDSYLCPLTNWTKPGSGGESVNLPGNPTFNNSIGDGNWHNLKFYVKLNSAPGVPDGIIRQWYDGTLMFEKENIMWIESGSIEKGFNTIGIGGNTFNNYARILDRNHTLIPNGDPEQWYAIDDVVVSTEPIPDDYVIGDNNRFKVNFNRSSFWQNETTEFLFYNNSQLSNLSNISFVNSFGKILFQQIISIARNIELTNKILIENKKITFNITGIDEFNKTKKMIFKNVTYIHPIVKKDNFICLTCINVSYNSTTKELEFVD